MNSNVGIIYEDYTLEGRVDVKQPSIDAVGTLIYTCSIVLDPRDAGGTWSSGSRGLMRRRISSLERTNQRRRGLALPDIIADIHQLVGLSSTSRDLRRFDT
jgi:hypothetical protein